MVNIERKPFWTHQLDCDVNFKILHNGLFGKICTDNPIASLAVSILFTNGEKPISDTGTRVGNRGGHWLTTYSGVSVGTVWDYGDTKAPEVQKNLIKSIAQKSLERMVAYGVATKVDVDARLEDSTIILDIKIFGSGETTERILLRKSPLKNNWIWDRYG